MPFSAECQQLLRSLERATARLAALNPEDFEQVARALEERHQAVRAMAAWIAAEQSCSRPASPDLAVHLKRDLGRGADVLVRLKLARAATVRDLKSLRGELQLLHSLGGRAGSAPSVIDCRG